MLRYYKGMWEKKLRDSLQKRPEPLTEGEDDQFAAALLLIIPALEQNQFEILLTKRTHKVERHKGEISLPGGFREEKDRNWLETALRETFEEIGVESSAIEILGCLSPVETKGATQIIPFVGLLKGRVEMKPNPEEVDKVLFLPLLTLLNQGVGPVVAREGSFEISSIGIFWQGELIWGATARILEQVYAILKT